MSMDLRPLRPGLRFIDALDQSTVVFLKASNMVILRGADPVPRCLHVLQRHDVRNSTIATAFDRDVAVFADGDRLFMVDVDGGCDFLVDMSSAMGGRWEVNWELASDAGLRKLYISALPSSDTRRAIRILTLCLDNGPVRRRTIKYPESGAYQIDPESGEIYRLVTTRSGMHALTYSDGHGVRRRNLSSHYNWMRIAPSLDRLLLSRAVTAGPISIVSLHPELLETRLPILGHSAGWAGSDRILYHSVQGELCLYDIDEGSVEQVIGVAPPLSVDADALGPPTSSHDGAVVVWFWMASTSSGAQRAGTAIIDLEKNGCRLLDSYWYRAAVMTCVGSRRLRSPSVPPKASTAAPGESGVSASIADGQTVDISR